MPYSTGVSVACRLDDGMRTRASRAVMQTAGRETKINVGRCGRQKWPMMTHSFSLRRPITNNDDAQSTPRRQTRPSRNVAASEGGKKKSSCFVCPVS